MLFIRKYLPVFFALTLVVQYSSNGQKSNYFTTQYTTSDGLPHNRIEAIVQDKSGLIWLGTWNGLSRFDGNDFINYQNNPKDSTTIPHFALKNICCDRFNNLWINANDYSLARYERIRDNFQTYSIKLTGRFHIQSKGVTMCLDTSGMLWIIGKGGIERFDDKSNSFQRINFDKRIPICIDDFPETPDFNMMFDNKNRIWIYNHKTLFLAELITLRNGIFIRLTNEFFGDKRMVYDKRMKFITNSSGCVFCISPYGLYYCKSPSRYFLHAPSDSFPDQIELPETTTWFTAGKIHIRMGNKNNDKTIELNKNEEINSILVDNAGNFWYSGFYNSIHIFNGLTKVTFGKYNFNYLDFREITNNLPNVYSIVKGDSGALIIGSNDAGILRWTLKRTVKIHGIVEKTAASFPEGLLLDHQKNLWVSYNDNNLIKYDSRLNRPVNILPRFAQSMGLDFISDIKVLTSDNQNNIIIGGSGGLAIFNPDQLTKSQELPFLNQVRSVCVNDKNDLLIGTQNDLLFFDRENNRITKPALPNRGKYWIEYICQYDSDTYWLGLYGQGLCRWEKKSNTFRFYSSKDGLCNNTVYCILKDVKNRLWISTNEGISCFNPVSEQFINFGVDEGVMVKEFNCGSCFQAMDGEMFFGGVEGLIRFYPDQIINKLDDQSHPKLIITDFKVSGVIPILKKPIYESDTIKLDAGTDNFQIGFVLLDFKKPDRVRYRYRLEGFNDEWIPTDHKHRSVNYFNLNPGIYIFKVEVTNSQGNWSNQRTWTIFIPRKFVQTIWFQTLIILLSLTGISIILYNRHHVLLLKEKRKEDQLSLALKESKLEILRKQLNPHFIFNSLTSINYYISLNDKIKANQYITDFSRLMRNILDNSSKEMIDFTKELETIEDYLKLEHVRFGNKFDFEIFAEEDLYKVETLIMPSMVQPFTENAIIHGFGNLKNRKGKIRIHFKKEEDHFITCTIEDDGIGRKKSEMIRPKNREERRSRGMEIISERLVIFNTINNTGLKITIEDVYPDSEETGTRVIIQIPAKQKP